MCHIDVELADTLQGQLFFLGKNPNRVSHELLGHSKTSEDIVSDRQQNYLCVIVELLEYIVDLVLEPMA